MVIDASSEQPIPLASVFAIDAVGDTVASTLTSDVGFFTVRVDGEFVLVAGALGYFGSTEGPFELEESAVQVVSFRLTPKPISIDGLDVTAENPALAATGFYRRMSAGRGDFITPRDVLESDARTTPDLFLGRRHVMYEYNARPWERMISFMSATERGNCRPKIWVDDVPLGRLNPGEGLNDVVPISNLLAAELFWGPFQAPIRYQGTVTDNPCGVVLLWTRGRRR